MSNVLVKDSVALEKKIENQKTQLMLESEIIVPDTKPDIYVVLQYDSNVCVDNVEVVGNKINYKGSLEVKVLYTAKENSTIHSMTSIYNIDDYIVVDELSDIEKCYVDVVCDISHIDYRVVNDRKLGYKAIVDVTANGGYKQDYHVVVDIDGVNRNNIKNKEATIISNVENKTDEFTIKDEFKIPQLNANISELLQSNVRIKNKEVRVSNDKIIVTGELLTEVLYKSEADDSIVEVIEQETSFNFAVEARGVDESMYADAILSVITAFAKVVQDEDEEDRAFEIEVKVKARVNVNTTKTLNVLDDAHIINHNLDVYYTDIDYSKLVCRNKNQSNVKEIIELDEHTEPMLRIIKVNSKACVDDVEVCKDRVIVNGAIDVDILYIAQNDDTPICSYKTQLPYTQVIETKNSTENMNVVVNINVENVTYNMLTQTEMEVRVMLSFDTEVTQKKWLKVVDDIIFVPMTTDELNEIASITAVVVKHGQTLWDIAKEYNTEVEDIVKVNDIENSNSVQEGQKLIVLKKFVVS